MPLIPERLKSAESLIKAVVAVVCVLGPYIALTELVSIPPEIDQLMSTLTFAISVVVVIAVLLLHERIERMRPGAVAAFSAVAVVTGAVMATAFFLFANDHLVTENEGLENETIHVLPISPSETYRDIVRPHGDVLEALYNGYRNDELRTLIEDENDSAVIALIVLLIAAEVLLLSGIVTGAWKIAGREDQAGGNGAPAGQQADQPDPRAGTPL